MRGIRKYLFLSAIATVWFCLSTRGQNATDPVRQLKFVESTTPIAWPGGADPVGGMRPQYAASMTIRSTPPQPPPDVAIVQDALTRMAPSGQVAFSPAQQAFWRTVVPALSVRISRIAPASSDANDYTVVLYAMTPEDAGAAAQAYVHFIDDQYHRKVADLEQKLRDASGQATVDRKKLTELGQPPAAARPTQEAAEPNVPYQGVDEAFASVVELNNIFDATQVEIAGIRAKIDAIRNYRNDPQTHESVNARLEVMLAEESIELRAAEARRDAAAEMRAKAREYIRAQQKLQSDTSQMDSFSRNLFDRNAQLQDLRRRLAAARKQTYIVLDSRVTIQPVAMP